MWFATLEPWRLRVDQIEVFQALINIELSIKKVARQCQHGEGRTSNKNLLCPETTQLLSHWSVVEAPRWFSPLSTMVGHPGMIRGNTENKFPSWQTDTCPDSA